MFCARLLLICAALWAGIAAQRVAETDMDPDFYCTGRAENEFFRKQMPEDITEEEARATCHTYYRCVPGGGNRRLSARRSAAWACSSTPRLRSATCATRSTTT